MTVEVRPIGEKCNIKCVYCYQEGVRAAGNVRSDYRVGAMIERLEAVGEPFTLFGGEIMLVDREDLDALLAYGRERHGGSGLQTNGTLVGPDDLDRFADYQVRLGISIDGPGPLNDARWVGSLAATRRATARTEGLIATLIERGRPPTLIVTLHRGNASAARFPLLCGWLGFLDRAGIRRVRLHLLEIDDPAAGEALALSHEEGLAVLRRLRSLERGFSALRFDLFDEIKAMLRGDDAATSCVFHPCDPYATRAVTGVEGDGRLTNCGRTNKDGQGYLKAEGQRYLRQIALHQTPYAEGGCRGCRFFLMCKGNCPGMAEQGDWRLRTRDCAVWLGLMTDAEAELVAEGERPLSLAPDRAAIEALAIAAWREGLAPTIAALRATVSAGAVTVAVDEAAADAAAVAA